MLATLVFAAVAAIATPGADAGGSAETQQPTFVQVTPIVVVSVNGVQATLVDYALPVELGSRPHIIESRGDYPLRNRKTGQVFGKRVRHPGTQAQPFLRPALDVLRHEA